MGVLSTESIAVAIFESNPILCDALCSKLAEKSGLLPGPATRSKDGSFRLLTGNVPDVVLLDVLEVEQDPSAIKRANIDSVLIGYFPGTASDTEQVLARACLSAGFRGLISKKAESDEVAAAVHMVARGGVYVDGSYGDMLFESRISPARLPAPRAQLTERETFVLQSVARGMSMKEISSVLDLSTKTVETYKARASSKLNLQNRREIVDYAIRSGWVQSVA
ncbi:MAG: response regulator transcription factor [Deltaproteobacteria bacterium]